MPEFPLSVKTIGGVLAAAVACQFGACSASESSTPIDPPAIDQPAPGANAKFETTVLAGGCFWGVQAVFQHVEGVISAVSGYAGGSASDANYRAVSAGGSGHAEAVQVTYDPKQITYGRLLQIFFSVAHDPTQLNRQGPDHGTQYRSAIFTATPAQADIAHAYVAQLDKAGSFPKPIVTEITPLQGFYPAETYHQDYATLNPNNPYIAINDTPKVTGLKRLFPDLYRAKPALVASSN